jgi:hypothetical protein
VCPWQCKRTIAIMFHRYANMNKMHHDIPLDWHRHSTYLSFLCTQACDCSMNAHSTQSTRSSDFRRYPPSPIHKWLGRWPHILICDAMVWSKQCSLYPSCVFFITPSTTSIRLLVESSYQLESCWSVKWKGQRASHTLAPFAYYSRFVILCCLCLLSATYFSSVVHTKSSNHENLRRRDRTAIPWKNHKTLSDAGEIVAPFHHHTLKKVVSDNPTQCQR